MTETSRHIYQAIGTIEGILHVDGYNTTLLTGEQAFLCTYKRKILPRLLSNEVQCFRVYPYWQNDQLSFKVIGVTDKPPSPFILKGCWKDTEGTSHIVIHRNRSTRYSDSGPLYQSIPLVWENAPAADGQFWEIEAELRNTSFVVVTAEGPFEPPIRDPDYIPKSKPIKASEPPSLDSSAFAQSKPTPAKTEAAPAPAALPLTVQEIYAMATATKAQVTCKFSEVPRHRELPDKQVEFFLRDGESESFAPGVRIFTVKMKTKMFKKLTDHGFADWIAAITGEMGPATETGFELVNASVQIFERKAREADTEAKAKPAVEPKLTVADPKPSAVARLEQSAEAGKGQAIATGGAKPEKGKGLLDGVELR